MTKTLLQQSIRKLRCFAAPCEKNHHDDETEDLETFLIRGQEEMRSLLFSTPTTTPHAIHATEPQRQHGVSTPPPPPPPTAVDWKLIMARAHELEQREKALLAEIERKAELRRQRYDHGQRRRSSSSNSSSSKTCHHCLLLAIQEPAEQPPCPRGGVRSSSSKNKKKIICDEMHMGLLPNKYNKSTSETSGSDETFTDGSSWVEDPLNRHGGLAYHKGTTTSSSRGHTWARFSGTSAAATESTIVVAYEPKYSTLSEF